MNKCLNSVSVKCTKWGKQQIAGIRLGIHQLFFIPFAYQQGGRPFGVPMSIFLSIVLEGGNFLPSLTKQCLFCYCFHCSVIPIRSWSSSLFLSYGSQLIKFCAKTTSLHSLTMSAIPALSLSLQVFLEPCYNFLNPLISHSLSLHQRMRL